MSLIVAADTNSYAQVGLERDSENVHMLEGPRQSVTRTSSEHLAYRSEGGHRRTCSPAGSGMLMQALHKLAITDRNGSTRLKEGLSEGGRLLRSRPSSPARQDRETEVCDYVRIAGILRILGHAIGMMQSWDNTVDVKQPRTRLIMLYCCSRGRKVLAGLLFNGAQVVTVICRLECGHAHHCIASAIVWGCANNKTTPCS